MLEAEEFFCFRLIVCLTVKDYGTFLYETHII